MVKSGISEYELLEREFADYVGTDYAVACNSGTSALHLALLALGVGPGDEVIVPEFTMIATAWAVTYTGATPVFVDCDERYNIDPKLIAEKITHKTKAIMVTHIYGRMADMPEVLEVAGDIPVVEDACEAHGAYIDGRRAGSWGEIGCFSFYQNKIVHAEEGGILTTDDEQIAEEAGYLKNMSFGRENNYIHDDVGYNYRMPESQAGMVRESLAEIERNLEKRKMWAGEMYSRYRESLRHTPRRAGDVVWVYDMLVKGPDNRNRLRMKLETDGYEVRPFFWPMSGQPMYREDNSYEDTQAFYLAERGLYAKYDE